MVDIPTQVITGGIALGLFRAIIEGLYSQVFEDKYDTVDYDLREARNKVCFFLFGYSE